MRTVLKRHKDKFIRRGYPWVFRNLIDRVEGDAKTGDVVEIASANGRVYGKGLYHERSQIAVRFLTRDATTQIDDEFYRKRVRRAVAFRMAVLPDTTHRRLIFGESDGLPGTIVDQYGDILTWSCLCHGMEQQRDTVVDELRRLVKPRMLVERNESQLRTKDDLEPSKQVLFGDGPATVPIEENGVFYEVDAENGPKTGFYIDQRWNRMMTSRFARGRRVLDAFCGDGGFGLQAASAGATHVQLVDISGPTIERAKANAERNGLSPAVDFEVADSLDRLGQFVDGDQRFDMVVLDPPAFAKSRRNIDEATRAYQRININGLRLLDTDGILATGSCSQAIDDESFLKVVRYASRKAAKSLRLLFRGSVSPDHPILASMPETDYLSFYIFQVAGDETPAWIDSKGR